jgi:UDPglucose 6-dehydrogenase
MGLELAGDPYEACEGADALVVLTEWPEFRSYDLTEAARRMGRPALVDTRNIFDPVVARHAGLAYTGMGRS